MSNLSPKNTLNLSLVHKICFKADKLTTKALKISTFPSVSLIDSMIQLSGFNFQERGHSKLSKYCNAQKTQ